MTLESTIKTRSKAGVLLTGLETKRNIVNNNQNKFKHTNLIENKIISDNNLISEMAEENQILDAMNIEELRVEITRLRDLSQFQRSQLTQLHNQIRELNSNQANNQLIQTLTESFRSLNIVDIKPPKYEENMNPIQFLNKFEKFCVLKQITGCRLNFLDGALEGRAKSWFDAQRIVFANFNDFKEKFLLEFYSIPIRVKIKSAWLARRFVPNKDSLQSYFLEQFNEAQYFLPKMDAYEVHYTIVQQMPIRVRENLATVDFENFEKISKALSQLDLTYGDKVNTQKKSFNHPNNDHESNDSGNKNNTGNKFYKAKTSNLMVHSNLMHQTCSCREGENFAVNCFPSVTKISSSNFDSNDKGNVYHNNYQVKLPDMSIPPPFYHNAHVFQSNVNCSNSLNLK